MPRSNPSALRSLSKLARSIVGEVTLPDAQRIVLDTMMLEAWARSRGFTDAGELLGVTRQACQQGVARALKRGGVKKPSARSSRGARRSRRASS